MATLTLLRLTQASHLSRVAGPQLLRRMAPLAASVGPSKTLAVTPRRDARIYGPAEGDHPPAISHWKGERVLAFALIPVIPAAFLFPSTALDYTVSAAVVLHVHWAFQGVTTDYVHGEYLRPLVKPVLLLMSMAAFGGLCYLNYNDIGIVRAVMRFFTEL